MQNPPGIVWIKRLGVGLLAVFILLPALLLAFINIPPGRAMVASLAGQWTGRKIEFRGHVYPLLAWPPTFHISDLTIANSPGGRDPLMADIGSMDIAPGISSLINGNMHIRRLALVNSAVHLERDAAGKDNWSFSSSPPQKNSPGLSLANMYFENSSLTYLDVPEQTDIKLEGATQQDQVVVTGTGKHLNRPFALKGEIPSSCLAERSHACPLEATLSVGHTSLVAKGTVDALSPPDNADFMIDLNGADAAELFPLFGIALPPTAPYHLAGHLTFVKNQWRFDNFKGTMGESDLEGDALWDISATHPKLTARLLSRELRFADLGALIGRAPAKPVSEEQKARAAQQQASAHVIPDLPLDISKLSSMDADVEFKGERVISEQLPLDDFFLKLSLDDRLMKFAPLRFGTAQGDISVNMIVNARQTPVRDHADIQFSHLKLAGLLHGVGKSIADIQPAQGEIGGTMTLSGEGSSLHAMFSDASGTAGLGMEGGSVSNLLIKLLSLDIARSLGFLLTGDQPLAIRCVVADFGITKGVMKTDNFVIDTADTAITGEGTVNLNNEMLNLRIIPAPKNATLLSLRSPIDIKGTLKSPSVSLEKGPLAARGAIATGLAAVAPLAAVAAFLEPGRGKDQDCAALMREMHGKTGKTAATDKIPKNH